MSAASDVIDDAGYDFSDLNDDEVTEVPDKPVKAGTSRTSGGSTAAPRRGGRRPVKRLEQLQKKLSQEMFTAGAMLGFMPVTGYYICSESDAFTKAVVELAAPRPEWIDALEHIANVQPGLVIGRTALGIGASIAVDRNKASADTAFMRFLGVYGAWKAIDEKKVPGESDGVSSYRPPPGQFTPVG